ncbi:PLP-dependent transferase [Stereum hirsutum FP-91666 SS1]|uniref:PLP-dependent transferase n=1 Tax=Stereum hirsutum (strain FP-91666) TaxID=721885 RepID=UPI000440F560|nr:PLP-dependent transferase [Stereum hirsutum FP-91666 SS1]EIM92817.1 PLP-dependent transferase [Stereum hirsutum FP-91666 SS1]
MKDEKHRVYKSIDFSHHLSDLAKRRVASPIKSLQKYSKPGNIEFGGDAFPIEIDSSSTPPSPLGWLWRLFGSSQQNTTKLTVAKTPAPTDLGLNLAVALQYGPATGLKPLQDFLQEFSARVYNPAFSDFTTLAHTGNTDGWGRVLSTLMNVGDNLLTDEWAYPTALVAARPFGLGVVPVGMDAEGMRPDKLRLTLDRWDEKKDGKKPRLLYTVPVGQNPSGSTAGLQRKSDIYDICVEHDIIICEDDPYYFLQIGQYVPKSSRDVFALDAEDNAQYLANLSPSYLSIDIQGRVIRMDTFSKTVAPGVRLGWFTCNPMFAERFERIGEVSSQSPCGVGQAMVTKLLLTWKFDGYVRWLRGIRFQYKLRRDLFLDIISEEFDLSTSTGSSSMGAWAGCTVYTAYTKSKAITCRSSLTGNDEKTPERKRMLSFVAPSSGMFLWLKLHFESIPKPSPDDPETTETKLWSKLAEAGVITAPSWFFATDLVEPPADPNVEGHFRMSFSNANEESMRRGVRIMAKTMRDFWN